MATSRKEIKCILVFDIRADTAISPYEFSSPKVPICCPAFTVDPTLRFGSKAM